MKITESPLLSSALRILSIGAILGLLAAWFLGSLGDARGEANSYREQAKVAQQEATKARAQKVALKAKVAHQDQVIEKQGLQLQALMAVAIALRTQALKPLPPLPSIRNRIQDLLVMGLLLEPEAPGFVRMPEEATEKVWTWGKQAERVPLLVEALGAEHALTEAMGTQLKNHEERAMLSDAALAACEREAAAQEKRSEALEKNVRRQHWRGIKQGATGGSLLTLLLVLLL